MATFNIPKKGEIYDNCITIFEQNFNPNIPASLKAFVKVLSVVIELITIGLYKFQAFLVRQNFTATAVGEDLDENGKKYGVERQLATTAILTIETLATDGTSIPQLTDYTGVLNNILYRSVSAVIADSSDVATVQVQAAEAGTDGNLQVGDKLQIQSSIPGLLSSESLVTVVDRIAVDEETDDVYRQKIEDEKQGVFGGGTSSDYRSWSQDTPGVARAYPYSGAPTVAASKPIQRTVFVEATPDISSDRTAPQSLLDEVRANITADPDTGIARQDMGLTDETLFVETITLAEIYIDIGGLNILSSTPSSTVETEITEALRVHLLAKKPYIDGLDSLRNINNDISDTDLGESVAAILKKNAATITSLKWKFSPTGTYQGAYLLGRGELSFSAGVVFL